MAPRIWTRLKREDGMTLPELLTAMAILGFVLTGILAVFVGGLRATTDMNERFQAQQSARLALTSMRKDIRSACSAAVGAVTGQATGSLVALTEPDVSAGCASTSQVKWCVDSTNHAAPFTLYRQTGANCAYNNGTSRAGSLTSNVVFGCSTAATARPQVVVTLPVDANLANTSGKYTLSDTITIRNAQVDALCS